jgi:hypothetical protein
MTSEPTLWSEAGLRQLASWGGMTEEDAEACGLFEVADASTIYPDLRAEAAIVIPYFQPNGEPMTFWRDGEEHPFCRVRYLEPEVKRMFSGIKTAPKYGQPGRSGTRAYFCPLINWPVIVDDIQEPLIITEGEAKAMVAAKHGLACIALGGVFNFMEGVEDLLPELELIKWRGRDEYTAFDSDILTNPNVLAAEARLTDELVRKRGARGYQVRLPQEGDKKEAVDTFLETYGVDAFTALLSSSPSLGALDAKVVSLNATCAWIEREGMVYDLEDRAFVSKDNFVSGSRFSTLKHITVGGGQRSAPKSLSVASAWLTHPHAQRYGEILFRPGLGGVVAGDTGRPALNMWNGWQAEHGVPTSDKRIAAWLELTAFLFRNLEPKDRDLAWKLMAYKAQNPMDKVPLAPVLIGDQGCGKSLWAECLAAAFNPYAVSIDSKEFDAEFQGWMEKSVLAVINEAKAHHLTVYGEALKALISDATRNMNEKFRPKRQIQSYTLYILTANDRAVGSFALDDRRMIVVECPRKMTTPEGLALYTYLGKRNGTWHKEGGPAALMGWLLDYDLEGWRPPPEAPMTAEKHNAYRESLSAVQELAEDMKVADGHSIEMWVDVAIGWAREAELSSNGQLAAVARATLEGVKHLQIRPWYEPRELTLLFPHLVSSVMGSKWDNATLPGKVSRELRNAGVRFLKNKDDPRGFKFNGIIRQYLVVCDYEEWESGISQADFDRHMDSFPTYGQRRGRK